MKKFKIVIPSKKYSDEFSIKHFGDRGYYRNKVTYNVSAKNEMSARKKALRLLNNDKDDIPIKKIKFKRLPNGTKVKEV